MQTHETLNIRVALVQHAREICQKSALNASEILRSELRLYIEVCIVNLQDNKAGLLPEAGCKATTK